MTGRFASTARDDTQGNHGEMEVCAGRHLTLDVIRAFCTQVSQAMDRPGGSLTINLGSVLAIDAVGLAAVLQAHRRAERRGRTCTIVASDVVYRKLIDARLLDEFSLVVRAEPRRVTPGPPDVEESWTAAAVATSSRVLLRQPGRTELHLFSEWAHDPLVDQMVGSEFLYRCRYLNAGDPELAATVLHDPTALTLLVVPRGGDARPVGFVRLYAIRLLVGCGFLETVITDRQALRKGLGIEASRLLLAYGIDVLGLRRVEAKVYSYNILSINALRRNGFQQEGVLREAHRYDDQAWDILVFSMLDDELRARRAAEAFPSFDLWSAAP